MFVTTSVRLESCRLLVCTAIFCSTTTAWHVVLSERHQNQANLDGDWCTTPVNSVECSIYYEHPPRQRSHRRLLPYEITNHVSWCMRHWQTTVCAFLKYFTMNLHSGNQKRWSISTIDQMRPPITVYGIQVAVCTALRALQVEILLKWIVPNQVLFKKIASLLTELSFAQ